MRQPAYHIVMKTVVGLIFALMISCVAKGLAETKPRNLKPLPVQKIDRQVCATKTAVVAVLDTGFNIPHLYLDGSLKLCKFGHRNFSSTVEDFKPQGFHDGIPVDNHGHGTNIVGLISKYAGKANYCIVVIKYYDPKSINDNNLENTVKAIEYATNIGAKYINYSGGGISTTYRERRAVKKFLDKGGKFIAAAGNERSDLSTQPYYPAMDDSRVVVVGSIEKSGDVSTYSNWGSRVNRYEYGSNQSGFGVVESGTSQATAIATGKIVQQTECDK